MHELLLYASIPPLHHPTTLSLLAGIAAHQPQLLTERHLIFKPTRAARFSAFRATGAGPGVGVMQDFMAQMKGDVYYLQVVGTVHGEEVPRLPLAEERSGRPFMVRGWGGGVGRGDEGLFVVEERESEAEWRLEFRDIPEPGKGKVVTSRLMASLRLEGVDVVDYMKNIGYSFVSEHLLIGHAFTHKSTRLFLYRPLFNPSSTASPAAPLPNSALSPSTLTNFIPYDPSGTHSLQASVRVQDGAKPELMSKGTLELVGLKDMLKGAIELDVGDRLALDTRVRG